MIYRKCTAILQQLAASLIHYLDGGDSRAGEHLRPVVLCVVRGQAGQLREHRLHRPRWVEGGALQYCFLDTVHLHVQVLYSRLCR